MVSPNFNMALTNARSLPAKLRSAAAAVQELDLNAFLITETFLTERREIKKKIKDFSNEFKLDFFTKNRGGDVARGGAAIVLDKKKGSFKAFTPLHPQHELSLIHI